MSPEMLTAVAALVAAVAWPVVALVGLFGRRGALRRLIESVESFSLPGGIEGKLRRGVEVESARILLDDPRPNQHITRTQSDAAERVGALATRTGIGSVRKQVFKLAREYERIRASMPAGDDRTRGMEGVATRLRTLALALEPLLPELTASAAPGDRLAALISLQVQPNIAFLPWLGERVEQERAFLQFHTCLALLSAARVFGGPEGAIVCEVVQRAKSVLDPNRHKHRWQVLLEAEQALAVDKSNKPSQPPTLADPGHNDRPGGEASLQSISRDPLG